MYFILWFCDLVSHSHQLFFNIMIKSLGNRIFLKKDSLPQMTGSILTPQDDGLYAPPYAGTIICVGPRVTDPDYKPGVRVLFHDIAGVSIKYDNYDILSIRDIDITAILFDKKITIM